MQPQFPSVNLEYLYYRVYKLLSGTSPGTEEITRFFETAWFYFQVISYTFSAVLFVILVYSLLQIRQIRIAENAIYKQAPPEAAVPEEKKRNEKWRHVEELSESDHPRDWRLAILEADILLDELVSAIGYEGDNLGEKLKSVEASDFDTLNQAWEAHKVRNQIAHVGSDFILTRRETRRVIDLYRQVFEEFHFI